MGWWTDRALPRLIDRALRGEPIDQLRTLTCAGLAGAVVELGFGSGLNVRTYPASVSSVTGIEPSDVAWRLAEPRIAAQDVPVTRGGLDGARLDLADASMDAALSTFTLCTIPDLDAALAEVARVLRPGGVLHFLEHGLAPDDRTVRWQRRLDGFQRRAFGGCRLTRDIPAAIAAAGLDLETDTAAYLPGPGLSHPWNYVHRGRARRPGGTASG